MLFLPLLAACFVTVVYSSNTVNGSCSTKVPACFNGGTCVDTKPKGFTCVCKKGFIGETCKTSQTPTRKLIKRTCPRLRIKNGSVRLMKKRTRAIFSCDDGYQLSGPRLKICIRGVWYNKRLLTCRRSKKVVPKRCKITNSIYQGVVRVHKDTPFMALVSYHCNSGYTLVGNSRRECRNGKWSSLLEPYCIRAKRCKKFKKLQHGTIFGGTLSGSLVRFVCHDGYELKGFGQSKCLSNGQWNSTLPKCIKIDPLRDLKNAADKLRRHFINKFELLTTDSRARAGLSSGAAGLDLVFVFDSSASVGQENFKKGIEFAQTIISEFGVSNSTSGTRVAVVVFSSTAEVIYNLQSKRIVNQQAAIHTLKNLKLRGKGTATKLALDTVIKEVVPERRNNSKKALFLITDGESNTGRDPASPAKRLRDVFKFEIYAIGVTLRRVNENELRDIASEPFRTHVYLLKDFKSLETLKDLITKPKGSNYSECGIAGDTGLRERSIDVAGRQESQPGAWPWMADIRIRDKHRCTGVLLAQGWVLTVAHCFENDGKVKASDVLVVLGEHDRTFMEGSEQYVRVEKIRRHKRYPKAKPHFDIVLLKLKNKVKLTSYVRTLCLPRRSDRIVIRPHGVGVMPGWGSAQTASGRPVFKILMQTKAKFISSQVCRRQFPHAISGRMICAVNPHLKSKDCSSDVGSPIIVHRSHREDWALVGFATKGNACVYKGNTGVFSNLLSPEYIRWIKRRLT